jgi:hypothetical protein
MPIMPAASSGCFSTSQPIRAISTTPTPDQIAYASPTGTVLSVSDSR